MSIDKNWKADPRLDKWRRRCVIWQRTHDQQTPMPITEDEAAELDDIFPADKRFVIAGQPGDAEVLSFGSPETAQRFVVIANGDPRP